MTVSASIYRNVNRAERKRVTLEIAQIGAERLFRVEEAAAELEVGNKALRRELRRQWEAAHAERCRGVLTNTSCAKEEACLWPRPAVLSERSRADKLLADLPQVPVQLQAHPPCGKLPKDCDCLDANGQPLRWFGTLS